MLSRIVVLVIVILSLSATIAIAGDSLVIVGAGYAPPWDTDFALGNGEREERVIWVGTTRESLSPCLSCPGTTVFLPPDGTGKTTGQTVLSAFAGQTGVTTLYVVPSDGSALPTVTARVVNQARPSQAIELPVVRFSTIEALNPAVLSFPAARRSIDSHSNLIVAEVSREEGRALSILVEAYSAAGERLGSAAFDLSTGTTLFLVDVLAQLGVPSLEDGQIRVAKTSGTGLMWGLLATVSDEGRVSVSLGTNP
jgi:hypothetical protein